MIKLSPTKYCQILTDIPDLNMTLSGWDYKIVYYLFGMFPVVFYTKDLIK